MSMQRSSVSVNLVVIKNIIFLTIPLKNLIKTIEYFPFNCFFVVCIKF